MIISFYLARYKNKIWKILNRNPRETFSFSQMTNVFLKRFLHPIVSCINTDALLADYLCWQRCRNHTGFRMFRIETIDQTRTFLLLFYQRKIYGTRDKTNTVYLRTDSLIILLLKSQIKNKCKSYRIKLWTQTGMMFG